MSVKGALNRLKLKSGKILCWESFDEGDEIDALAKEYEPVQLDEEGVITVEELVEEELLLSIPLSALHPKDNCAGTNDLDRINAEAKRQPFADLASLIKDKD